MKSTVNKRASMNQAVKSFVVSVSLGAGCYRHIKILANSTLENLSWAILDAFCFDDDHAHAFFMDNRAWSGDDCYYFADVDEDNEFRHTCDYTLDHTLSVGRKFKYVFDFGEDWTFECKVLRAEDSAPTPEAHDAPVLLSDQAFAQVVRKKGEPPEQYGTWDEGEEDPETDDE